MIAADPQPNQKTYAHILQTTPNYEKLEGLANSRKAFLHELMSSDKEGFALLTSKPWPEVLGTRLSSIKFKSIFVSSCANFLCLLTLEKLELAFKWTVSLCSWTQTKSSRCRGFTVLSLNNCCKSATVFWTLIPAIVLATITWLRSGRKLVFHREQKMKEWHNDNSAWTGGYHLDWVLISSVELVAPDVNMEENLSRLKDDLLGAVVNPCHRNSTSIDPSNWVCILFKLK